MKKPTNASTLLLAGFVSLSSVNVTQASDWRLLRSQYNTTASKLVTKDYGSVSIDVQSKCAANYSDVENSLRETISHLIIATAKSSNLNVQSKYPELTINTSSRYTYSTDPKNDNQTVVVDNCKNGHILSNTEIAKTDLTATTFEGGATLVIEANGKLSDLTTIQQKLGLYAEDLTKDNSTLSITVGAAEFALSAKSQQEVNDDLNAQNSLQGPNKTRLSIDKEVSGGFKEEYYTEVSDSSAVYKSITPTIDNEGRSVVSAYYTFDVKFLPSNLSAAGAQGPDDLLGSAPQTVQGTFITDTDYYVARVNLTTQCHPTRAAATSAMSEAYKTFKEKADEVIDTKNEANPERVESKVSDAQPTSSWVSWERQTDKVGFNGPKNVRYINTCTGDVVTTENAEELPKTYLSSQSITVITKNYRGLKALQAAVTQYNEGKAGPTRVQTSSVQPSPRLNPRKHFEAVEIHAYKNAVDKLLSAQGTLAKLLLDQVKSSEAYYSLDSYSLYPESRHNSGRSAFGSASPMAPQSGLQTASDGDLSGYTVLVTGDDNVPQAEKNLNKVYSVSYKPAKDLIAILKEKRAAATAQIVPSRQ